MRDCDNKINDQAAPQCASTNVNWPNARHFASGLLCTLVALIITQNFGKYQITLSLVQKCEQLVSTASKFPKLSAARTQRLPLLSHKFELSEFTASYSAAGRRSSVAVAQPVLPRCLAVLKPKHNAAVQAPAAYRHLSGAAVFACTYHLSLTGQIAAGRVGVGLAVAASGETYGATHPGNIAWSTGRRRYTLSTRRHRQTSNDAGGAPCRAAHSGQAAAARTLANQRLRHAQPQLAGLLGCHHARRVAVGGPRRIRAAEHSPKAVGAHTFTTSGSCRADAQLQSAAPMPRAACGAGSCCALAAGDAVSLAAMVADESRHSCRCSSPAVRRAAASAAGPASSAQPSGRRRRVHNARAVRPQAAAATERAAARRPQRRQRHRHIRSRPRAAALAAAIAAAAGAEVATVAAAAGAAAAADAALGPHQQPVLGRQLQPAAQR